MTKAAFIGRNPDTVLSESGAPVVVMSDDFGVAFVTPRH